MEWSIENGSLWLSVKGEFDFSQYPVGGSFRDVGNRLFFHKLFRMRSRRQRQIIYERYYCCKTQSDVAASLDISKTQVSRLEKEALHCLGEVARET